MFLLVVTFINGLPVSTVKFILAVLAVRRRLAKHPEDMLEFREAGIIL